jgi:hypothetical protein
MTAIKIEDKIDRLYKEIENIGIIDSQVAKIHIKNVENLITYMIKHYYEWEEIVAVIRMIKKGKGEDLIKIIKDTIN